MKENFSDHIFIVPAAPRGTACLPVREGVDTAYETQDPTIKHLRLTEFSADRIDLISADFS